MEDHGDRSIASSASSSLSGATSISSQNQFKMQVQYSILPIQRIVAELKSSLSRDKVIMDELHRTRADLHESCKSLDSKLANLQKVVAMQADSVNATKKKVADAVNENASFATAIRTEIESLKSIIEGIERKIVEVRSGGGGGAVNIPANISQLFEALETQLGMYDVKIAEMEVKFKVLDTTNYNGNMIWKISDFARRKEDARSGRTLSTYSQPFFTSRYGYKMCLRIYLNGDGMGKNTHVSLFFVLMRGEYDGLLSFPFRQKVTLMLLDQSPERRHLSDVFRPDPSSSSFRRPTTDMNIASGCPMFVSHDTLNNSSYLKEDTIFIRCFVDTSDLENY